MNRSAAIGCVIFSALVITFIGPQRAVAHCDGLDGPVVRAAQQALASGNVSLVLIWVGADDESKIRAAFDKTVAVRKLHPQARELADLYFFETLVRIHRAGEGAPYTGLKPAGRNLGPAIPAADEAIKERSVEPLVKLITDESASGIRKRFQELIAAKRFDVNDVSAGREFVKRYVEFVHYVEGLYQSAQGGADEHIEGAGTHREH